MVGQVTIKAMFWTWTLESLLETTRAITRNWLPGAIVVTLVFTASIGVCHQIRASLIILMFVVVISLPIAIVLLVILATIFLALA